jgi:hypothetical protein
MAEGDPLSIAARTLGQDGRHRTREGQFPPLDECRDGGRGVGLPDRGKVPERVGGRGATGGGVALVVVEDALAVNSHRDRRPGEAVLGHQPPQEVSDRGETVCKVHHR